MTIDLPTLNLACLKNPRGRCVLVAESCVNCRNRDIILKHAAAYQKEADESVTPEYCKDSVLMRDAVLDLLPKEMKEKKGGDGK